VSFVVIGAAGVGAGLGAVPASAYLGYWPSTSGCPVDDPEMLASPGGDYTACVGIFGGGPMKIGNLDFRASFSVDFGVHGPTSTEVTMVTKPWSPYAWHAATDVENTTAGLPLSPVCSVLFGDGGPATRDPNSPYQICVALQRQYGTGGALKVRVEPVGPPSGFHVAAAGGTGQILSVPIRVRLADDVFGPDCTIGSAANPIVLHLTATAPTNGHYSGADANGYPVQYDSWSGGGDYADATFAAPAARGCGSGGSLDTAVNLALGLPSPSGRNSFSVYRMTSINATTSGGHLLSDAFHAAFG
jgi:hypothetical protein